MKLTGLLGISADGNRGFWCPGCKEMHFVSPFNSQTGRGWTFNDNYDRPSFGPSILVTNGHHCPGFKQGESCWCTFNAAAIAAGEEPSGFQCHRCHSIVTDGKVQFLSDCTHALAGQTVQLKVPPTEAA